MDWPAPIVNGAFALLGIPADAVGSVELIDNRQGVAAFSGGELFKEIDADKNGLLDKPEFFEYCNKLRPLSFDQPQAEAAFDKLDTDKDGALSVSEFLTALTSSRSRMPLDMLGFGKPIQAKIDALRQRLDSYVPLSPEEKAKRDAQAQEAARQEERRKADPKLVAEEGAKAEAQKFTDDAKANNRTPEQKRRARIQAAMAEAREAKAKKLRSAPEADGLAGQYLLKADIATPRHGPMTPAPTGGFPDLFPEEQANDAKRKVEDGRTIGEVVQDVAKVDAIMEKADTVALSTYAQAKMMGDAGYVMFDIVVSGAGSEAANGLYEPAQPSSNYPQWKRFTQATQRPRRAAQSWCIYWKKCKVPRGRPPRGEWVMLNKKEATIYYKNGPLVPDEADKVPPEGGWKRNRDAGKESQEPAPSIAFQERKEAMKV